MASRPRQRSVPTNLSNPTTPGPLKVPSSITENATTSPISVGAASTRTWPAADDDGSTVRSQITRPSRSTAMSSPASEAAKISRPSEAAPPRIDDERKTAHSSVPSSRLRPRRIPAASPTMTWSATIKGFVKTRVPASNSQSSRPSEARSAQTLPSSPVAITTPSPTATPFTSSAAPTRHSMVPSSSRTATIPS